MATVTIDKSDTTYKKMEIQDFSLNKPTIVSFVTTVMIDIGDELIITNGASYLFRGYVTNVNKRGSLTVVIAQDKLDRARRIIYSNVYENQCIELIFKDLVEQAGLTYWKTTSEVDTTATPTLDKYIIKDESIFINLEKLAKAINYMFEYNYTNDNVEFKAIESNDSNITLTIGTNATTKGGWWKKQDKGMVNDVILIGGKYQGGHIETFSGDGATTDFTLLYPPDNTIVKVGGAIQKYGVSGVDSTYDYTIDKQNKKISFTTAPASGTDNIEVTYQYSTPIKVDLDNSQSISLYDKYQARYIDKSIQTMTDARTKAKKILDSVDTPITNKVIYTGEWLNAGEKVRVIDTKNSIDDYFYVTSVKHRIGVTIDIVTVSSAMKTYNITENTEARIKKLEQEQEHSDIVQKYKIFPEAQKAAQTLVVKKYKRYPYDSFILGHSINGLLGMGAILDNMNTAANWSSATATLADNTTATYIKVGSTSMSAACTAGLNEITTAQSFGDLSAYTGAASGLPIQGTIGLWAYITDGTGITSIKLKIGSDSSNYIECEAGEYTTRHGTDYTTTHTTGGYVTGWNYLLFDLDTGTATGTPAWTATSYADIEVNTTAQTIYLDYFTISKSNYIGLNGLGNRVGDKILI